MSMATMNIKDPAIHDAARRLASARGVSMTEAVRQAIDEALERTSVVKDDAWMERMLDLARQVREASDEPFLTDDDLYDEFGLPK
jgi:antitoxin VapB